MDRFVIFARYYVFTITLSACCVNYAHSTKPEVPGKRFGFCLRLEDVMEQPANEKLRLAESDIVHICRIESSQSKFCLVISKETAEPSTPECREFNSRDAKITFLKPMEFTKMLVFQNGAVRWNLSFAAKSDSILRSLYFGLSRAQDQLRTLARTIDLWKRNDPQSDFVKIATQPFVIIDNEFENWNVLHVVSMVGDEKGPLFVITKGKMTTYTAEGEKVYMSLRDFPLETYFFTCASKNLAESLSNALGQYNVQGVAVPRN